MLPTPVCLLLVALLGVVLGAAVNWATYVFGWTPRQISPWSAPPLAAPARSWIDRVPVIGWWGLRREEPLHGKGFWMRPLLVEVGMACGLAALYWWEVVEQGLIVGQLPFHGGPPMKIGALAAAPAVLHATFFSHVLLISLMAAASLVDIDDKIIPDAFTVTGALMGLILAAVLPFALLPQVEVRGNPAPAHFRLGVPPRALQNAAQQLVVEPVAANAPNPWPPALLADRRPEGLLIGLSCFALWCFALTTRIYRGRRGVVRGLQIVGARVVRDLCQPPLSWIGVAGAIGIVAVWSIGGASWLGLSTALAGMIGGGALVWATRLAGASALRVEAMGFGDVTLMMMVGAFIGWQAGVVVFFVAPFAGLVAGLLQLILRRGNVIPYGPYLCLGTLVVVVRWADIWNATRDVFGVGWFLWAMLAVIMALLWAMLVIVRVVKIMIGLE